MAMGINRTGRQFEFGFAGACVPIKPTWGLLKFNLNSHSLNSFDGVHFLMESVFGNATQTRTRNDFAQITALLNALRKALNKFSARITSFGNGNGQIF